MGLISVIDCKMGHDQLAVRSFIEDFNSKSQLIVDESQSAIFYKDGQGKNLISKPFTPKRFLLVQNEYRHVNIYTKQPLKTLTRLSRFNKWIKLTGLSFHKYSIFM